MEGGGGDRERKGEMEGGNVRATQGGRTSMHKLFPSVYASINLFHQIRLYSLTFTPPVTTLIK